MIISHKYKFIYFKAKKVAGTSTEILLGDFCDDNDIVTPLLPKVKRANGSRNYKGFGNHSLPRVIRNKIGKKLFNSYYKFITVRNPFDRVVSRYWGGSPKNSFTKFVKGTHRHRRCLRGLDPLHQWIYLKGECLIDDYIRYENLENDTKQILGKWFDVHNLIYPTAKTQTRKNKSKHYTEYYNDETREIVAKKYAKDIEMFGYKFGE